METPHEDTEENPEGTDSPGHSGRDLTEDMLGVDLDPVSQTEERLRDQIDQGGEAEERAREQLEWTGGIHAALKYMESAVPIENFGPDPGDEEARKDLAIVLGNLAVKYDAAFLRKYEDEIYAFTLVTTLYGVPIVQQYGRDVWNWYKNAALNGTSNGQSDDRSGETEKREEHSTEGD